MIEEAKERKRRAALGLKGLFKTDMKVESLDIMDVTIKYLPMGNEPAHVSAKVIMHSKGAVIGYSEVIFPLDGKYGDQLIKTCAGLCDILLDVYTKTYRELPEAPADDKLQDPSKQDNGEDQSND